MNKNTKRFLTLIGLMGVIAVATSAGSGTFAGFTAEVSNNGNYFATGTLFLHATDGGGSTCASEAATNNLNITNVGGTCNALFSVNLTSATAVTSAQLTLKNAGTLPSSDIQFSSPGCTDSTNQTLTDGTLSGSISNAAPITSIAVNALTYAIPSGTTITVTDNTNSDTFTTSAAAAAGATTISVTSHQPTNSYVSGNFVKSAPSFGAGTLCGGLQYAIVETDSSFHDTSGNHALGCAYGFGVDGTTNGCTFGGTYTVNNIPGSMTSLTLASSGGTGNTGTQLSAGGTRYFLIQIQPSGGSLDNTYQNKKATFDLRWQINQA